MPYVSFGGCRTRAGTEWAPEEEGDGGMEVGTVTGMGVGMGTGGTGRRGGGRLLQQRDTKAAGRARCVELDSTAARIPHQERR